MITSEVVERLANRLEGHGDDPIYATRFRGKPWSRGQQKHFVLYLTHLKHQTMLLKLFLL
jgi:hypothetical protein